MKSKAKKKAPKTAALAKRGPSVPALRQEISLPEKVEQVLLRGDLKDLTSEERLDYYKKVCKSLGLNPLTMPFGYIAFKERDDDAAARLTLYAKKDAAEQLRALHGISIIPGSVKRSEDEDYATVELGLRDKYGKTDIGIGIVYLWKNPRDGKRYRVSGVQLANARMKAETKAKRRGTLSICGLAFLDETELEGVRVVGGVTPEGRYFEQTDPEDQSWNGHGYTPGQQEIVDEAKRKLKGSPAVDSGVSPAGPGAGSPAGQPASTFKDVGLVRITKSGEEGTAHVNLALKACRELEFLTDIVKNELKGSWIEALSVWSIPLSGVPVVMSACKDFKIQGFAEKGLVEAKGTK